MVYDSTRDRLMLFGGYGTDLYDDLWSWSPSTREWTQISVSGTRPSGALRRLDVLRRRRATRCSCSGTAPAATRTGSTTRSSTPGRTGRSTSPPAGVSRSYFDVAFDSDRGKIVMLGRRTLRQRYNTDIWEWDTTTGVWAQLMPATGSAVPDGRYYHTIAYDSIRRADPAGRRLSQRHRVQRAGQRLVGVGRQPAALERDHADGGQAPATLQPPDGVQFAARDGLPLRRHGA